VRQKTIYFYQLPDGSESRTRGIGFYFNYLIRALKKQNIQVSFFTKEQEAKDHKTVIHYPWLHPYFLTAPLLKRCPRVITVHDLIPLKYPKLYPPGLRAKFVWPINKKIIQKADAVITDSLTSKNDIIRFCWPISAKKIHIVPLAPDPLSKPLKSPKMPSQLKNYLTSKLKHFVLYVGDINPSKNVPSLVKACIELKIPLLLVGKKFLQKDYDRAHPENTDLVFVQKAIKNNPELVIPTGFISQQDLTALYNLATVYCQPSFEEGFGLPVLDAMSCGCPVAVSQTSAVIEITKTNAFLFDPNSINSLKQALRESLTNSRKRKKFTQAGLKRAKQYSWQKTAKQTIIVYQKLLS
jgi:glycosyltransferase involved in cell wall biosynthesis